MNDLGSPLAGEGSQSATEMHVPFASDGELSGASDLGALEQPERSRRGVRVAAVAAIVLVGAAIALAILLPSHGKARAGAGAGVPAGDTTTTVQRRTLTEHAQVDGTLGYGSTLELYDRIPGTFTWLPSVGAVIGRGGTLFKVDQLPIVLMYGSVPAYRTLKLGVSDGEDITELNENLVALGYDPYGAIADYEDFSEATAAAVRRWQQAEELPQTGEVELGRMVFAPSARRVTALKATLGQDPPGGKAGAEEPATDKEAAKDPAGKGSPSKSPSSDKSPSGEEASAGAGTPVLTTTSTQQLVQLQLEADKQQLARVGESAPVTLPSGQTVGAHITSVGTVATESSDGGGEAGGGKASIAVTLSLDRRAPHLDAAPVTVELIEEKRRNVLTVPATALIATAGGGYAVQALESGRRVEVPVTPGMFADGYVQIEGQGAYEGLTITQPAE
ncbi:MAG TPA: peptidoglycan-binding protein [Solirubrobacteraceae bacterium]|nr:peptidoglycan-binding protein [Solirubrobacteraceae bacterium]